MFEVQVNVDLDEDALLEQFGLQPFGPVQTAIDEAVIRYMEPYWAYDTGRLVNSVYTHSQIGSGEIVYETPYVKDMYTGVRENGAPVNYRTQKHPLAGPFPLERMLADHYDDIIEEAQRVVGSK